MADPLGWNDAQLSLRALNGPIQVVSSGPKTLQDDDLRQDADRSQQRGSVGHPVFAPGSGRILTIPFIDCRQLGTSRLAPC